MLGKASLATYKCENVKVSDDCKNVHNQVATLLSDTNINPSPPEERKDSVQSSSNVDDEITELQRCF